MNFFGLDGECQISKICVTQFVNDVFNAVHGGELPHSTVNGLNVAIRLTTTTMPGMSGLTIGTAFSYVSSTAKSSKTAENLCTENKLKRGETHILPYKSIKGQ